MNNLVLDASSWKTSNDFYEAFFRAVEAPEWHGRNFNALRDSISTGGINKIQVPYRIVIQKFNPENDAVREFLTDLKDLIFEMAASGCPVDIQIEH
jgi:RNAse (barnase) inhibitor barstar